MAEPKKIILLEDDRASSHLVSTFLEKNGYNVVQSGEARIAMEIAMREKPDLLIADVMLPDMPGSEAVKQLKATSLGNSLKVMFLTSLLKNKGEAGQETLIKVDGIGYPALAKPFKPEALLGIVERLVGGDN